MNLKLLLPLSITSIIFSAQALSQKKNSSPNLIIILTDDLGYADVSFNGCKDIPTPNIDRIANNGIKCTNAYVTYSVSGPSRAGLMTGRYGQRFGFERNPQYQPHDPNMGLPKDEATLAEALSNVGYTSGIIGKWHLGADISNHPLNRGFNEFFGHLGGGHRYFPKELEIKDSYLAQTEAESYRTWIMRNHEPVQIKKYLTDEFSDEALSFVSKHKEQPFFLYLAYNAPHAPLQAPESYLSRFSSIQNEKRRTYAAMVSAVDDGVGRLLDKLDELSIDDNTLVFFLSDNGGSEQDNTSDNGILRAGKSSIYEGGFRVPYAVMWKGVLSHGVYNKPVSSLDIYATIAALSAAPINSQKPLDGVNLMPYLRGKNKNAPHENIYLRKYDEKKMVVRHKQHKLISLNNGETKELYNLDNDVSETNNIIGQKPKLAEKLSKISEKWQEPMIEPIFEGLFLGKR